MGVLFLLPLLIIVIVWILIFVLGNGVPKQKDLFYFNLGIFLFYFSIFKYSADNSGRSADAFNWILYFFIVFGLHSVAILIWILVLQKKVRTVTVDEDILDEELD